MKALVCVKRFIDYNVKLRIKSRGGASGFPPVGFVAGLGIPIAPPIASHYRSHYAVMGKNGEARRIYALQKTGNRGLVALKRCISHKSLDFGKLAPPGTSRSLKRYCRPVVQR
jgi:hypothetical protein